ncbi:MAG: sugar ABC transporter substrate-binding protein [Eubacterium sp.]|nr:sugar ABC transporter substrate-binding protein [Eubacterium sp.]
MIRKSGKKLLSILMCMVLAASMLVGCGEGGAESGSSDDGKIKIGVSIWSSTDSLGTQCKKILDQAAAALGDVELQYIDQGHVSEKVTASAETLVSAGCQGILICNSADSEMAPVIKTCNESGVYLAQFFRVISETESSDIYDLAKESEYFVGSVHENEPDNGEKLGNILLEKGCRKIGMIGWEQGDATWLGRIEGYKRAVDTWNAAHPDDLATLTSPQYAGTSKEGGAKAAEALMSAHADLDALVPAGGGGEPLEGTLSAIEKAGKVGDIKVVSTDFRDDLETRLKDGSITAESGGHYCDPLFALLIVYNAIKGNYKDFGGTFNEILYPYLYVDSPEAYADYDKYFVKASPYTDDEIREMAGLDYQALVQKATTLSIEDAAARSKK